MSSNSIKQSNKETQFIKASFIKRLNRFVGIVTIHSKEQSVYIPNTGKLSELLIPGREVILVPSTGKYTYKLLYVMYDNQPIMIDSIYSNQLFKNLLNNKSIPKLKSIEIIKQEPAYKNHRFDFLIKHNNSEKFIELKSCTLGWKKIASFPDAESKRAVEHIKALAETENGILVFLILHSNIKVFVPNYHRDFEFYKTLKQYRNKIKIYAFAVQHAKNFEISGVKPVDIVIPDVTPGGKYLILLYNSRKQKIEVGKLGEVDFPKGYYLYIGSSKINVFKRIAYHKRKKINKHWHLDYITENLKITADIPLINCNKSECFITSTLETFDGKRVTNFGSSDCDCYSHLLYFKKNPLHNDELWSQIFTFQLGQYLS